MTDETDKVAAVQHMLASIFTAQRALRAIAPDYRWTGLGNLLGDYGEFVAINHYGLLKAPSGSSGFDAVTNDGKSIQIKTNYHAKQIGFRGEADLLLVVGVNPDGSWQEIYYGDFAIVRDNSRYSARDNKHMIALSKLKALDPK